MASQWYYGKDGKRLGPLSSNQLKDLAASGTIRPTDLVWKQGMSGWVEAHKVQGLFPAGASAAVNHPAAAQTPLIPAEPQSNAPSSPDYPDFGESPAPESFNRYSSVRKRQKRSQVGVGIFVVAGLLAVALVACLIVLGVRLSSSEKPVSPENFLASPSISIPPVPTIPSISVPSVPTPPPFQVEQDRKDPLHDGMPGTNREVRSTVDSAGRAADHTTTRSSDLATASAPPAELTNSLGMKLILIPAGEFKMGNDNGSSDEKPAHRVRIRRPFYLGVTEVTQGQYEQVMGTNPSTFTGDSQRPVEQVSWIRAMEFCKRLSQKEERTYGLPTEAQWEYACRAGTSTKWCSGDDESSLGGHAWYRRNSNNRTHPVGQKRPNAWGLHDMHGNVWEWCADWYDEGYYRNSPTDDPAGPSSGSGRVNRGGGWGFGASLCPSAARSWRPPELRGFDVGFRVLLVSDRSARDLPPNRVAASTLAPTPQPDTGAGRSSVDPTAQRRSKRAPKDILAETSELLSGLGDDAYSWRSFILPRLAAAQAKSGDFKTAIATATGAKSISDRVSLRAIEAVAVSEAKAGGALLAIAAAGQIQSTDDRARVCAAIAEAATKPSDQLWVEAALNAAVAAGTQARNRSLALERVATAQARAGRIDDAATTVKLLLDEKGADDESTNMAVAEFGAALAKSGAIARASQLQRSLSSSLIAQDILREGIAIALAKKGEFKQAISFADEIVSETSKPSVIAQVAMACSQAGRQDDARSLFNQASEAVSQLAQTTKSLQARLLSKIAEDRHASGDPTGASNTLDRAHRLAEDASQSWERSLALVRIALAHMKCGDESGAGKTILEARQALGDEWSDGDAPVAVANGLVALGKYDEAIVWADNERKPGKRALVLLGVAEGLLGVTNISQLESEP